MSAFLKRPFYLYTPRNKYGEELTSSCPYEVRSTNDKKVYGIAYFESMNREEAEAMVKKMNDDYEAMQSIACNI
jgi:hypothetical protein